MKNDQFYFSKKDQIDLQNYEETGRNKLKKTTF